MLAWFAIVTMPELVWDHYIVDVAPLLVLAAFAASNDVRVVCPMRCDPDLTPGSGSAFWHVDPSSQFLGGRAQSSVGRDRIDPGCGFDLERSTMLARWHSALRRRSHRPPICDL